MKDIRLIQRILLFILLVSAVGCKKDNAVDIPGPPAEGTYVIRLSGEMIPFDSPTKASEVFQPSYNNLICLRLWNQDEILLQGEARYWDRDPGEWYFSYQGTLKPGITTGFVEGYLFERNWGQSNDGTYTIGPTVPVYECTSGTFTVKNDTLFVNASFSPATGRICFTHDLPDGQQRYIQYINGISYINSFDPVLFWAEKSSAEFFAGWRNNTDYFYGLFDNPENPVLGYRMDSYYYVKNMPATSLQKGKSGYAYLPEDSNSYSGWKKYRNSYEFSSNYRWVYFRFVQKGSLDSFDIDNQKVSVPDCYYMMDCEVYQGLWATVMGGPSEYYNDPAKPVRGKSWEEIQQFIQKMEVYYGYHFRMPTEEEWEYAARGGINALQNNQDYLYSGSNNLKDVARMYTDGEFNEENPFYYYITSRSSNALYLYDMSGDVAEMCADWFSDDPSLGRVVRGGSAYDYEHPERCTNYYRSSEADYPADQVGFRLVMIPPIFAD